MTCKEFVEYLKRFKVRIQIFYVIFSAVKDDDKKNYVFLISHLFFS